MKKLLGWMTKKKMILVISCVISVLIFLVLSGISSYLAEKQDSQMMAARWSDKGDVAQVSCFLSQSAGLSEDAVLNFEHKLDSALVEASIVSESENENARLWADAYSATGKITMQSNQASVTVNAVGIGGDFFLFHPVTMESGSYFSGNDVMKDYCIVDEETAWQLFGSNDIAGQYITIGGIPHIITGVYSREEGRLPRAAGLDSSLVFVSYETLSKYGMANKIGCFEIVMPNPVKNYALNYVKENMGIDEADMEVVENTTRYSLFSLLEKLGGFGTRSMNGKAIIYPYWENIARGYEDILILMLVFRIMFIAYPCVVMVVALVIAWKHKKWTTKSVFLMLKDKWEFLWEKLHDKRRRKKGEKMF